MRKIHDMKEVIDSGVMVMKYGKWTFLFFLVKGLIWLLFAAGVAVLNQ